MRLISIALCLFGGIAYANVPESQPQHTHDSEDLALEVTAFSGLDSSYFSEGRDALDGDSLWVNSVELAYGKFSGGVWYGNSPDQDYDELQIGIGYAESFGDFEIAVGYTRFQFPFESAHDNEVGTTLTWSNLPMGCEFSADAYYSFDAEGYFVELALGHEVEVSENFSLVAAGIAGINQGYVSDGHDGLNNLALRLEGVVALAENWHFISHLTYSWAVDANPALEGDAQLIDFFHGGFGLEWSF
ncbi:MAG: hypothetical protein AB3N63_04540 [Puniceicoccaceae bacterium]